MNSSRNSRAQARMVLDSIRRIVRGLRVLSRRTERSHQLSAAQLFILQSLSADAAITLNELARRTFTDQSSVSTALRPLVSRGLVEKRPAASDGRALALRLSSHGRLLLRGQPDAFQTRLIKATLAMRPAERQGLARGLHSLLKLSGLAEQSAGMLPPDGLARKKAR